MVEYRTDLEGKGKIRLALKETQKKDGLLAKELIERRFKTAKSILMKVRWLVSSRRWATKRTRISIKI